MRERERENGGGREGKGKGREVILFSKTVFSPIAYHFKFKRLSTLWSPSFP